ncbi:MAG: low molecular weight phosphotyrosine protein phosphatase [Deltaproteobacteria bacterium]|nr:low molecular weight phosphotyrosine protein phosphatase [Nannocystaceae bacterium]
MSSSPIGVLFVCHANLCRSPLAEGIFAAMVRERGLTDRFEIDSAGCWAQQGLTPHPNSIEIASRNGLSLGDFVGRSRVVVPDDLHRFDHVLAMDRSNLADLQRLRRLSAFGPVTAGKARIRLLRHVVDPKAEGLASDVPDPVRHALDAYGDTWTILSLACARLLDELAPR